MKTSLLVVSVVCIYNRLMEIVVGYATPAPRSTQIVRLRDGSPVVGNEHLLPGGKRVSEFLGIPYAEAPTGQRRFGPPVEKSKWTQVFNATKLPNSCPQAIDTYFGRSFRGSEMWNANTQLSEDCLYINVWAPQSRDRSPLPVMVWIYGGGFSSGTSTLSLYDGKTLACEENVIVVSFNYRVSAFGFLYLGMPEVPGNMGMLDQSVALKWTKRNIEKFNGDPVSLTLFGESAGADSVNLHAFSPLSKTLFKRLILQSGVALAHWSLSPKSSALERSLTLARHLGCYDDTTEKEIYFRQIFDCLIRKSTDDILEAASSISYGFLDLTWAPIVDGHFLMDDPRFTMEKDDFTFQQDQAMIGTNLNEGNYFLVYLLPSLFPKGQIFEKSDFLTGPTKFEKAILTVLPAHLRRNSVVCSAVLFEYTPYGSSSALNFTSKAKISVRNFQTSLDNLINDFYFTCDSQEMAKRFVNGRSGGAASAPGTLFYYQFSHRSSSAQPWPEWMGVLHGDEIAYVFGEPLSNRQKSKDDRYSEEDRKLSRAMMRYWANFARTGNPNINPDGSLMPDSWPIFTNNQEYKILSTKPAVAQRLRSRQCVFWKQYIPYLYDATRDLTEAEVKWKREFTKWQNEYIVDWKNQFDQYRMLQGYKYYNSQCNRP